MPRRSGHRGRNLDDVILEDDDDSCDDNPYKQSADELVGDIQRQLDLYQRLRGEEANWEKQKHKAKVIQRTLTTSDGVRHHTVIFGKNKKSARRYGMASTATAGGDKTDDGVRKKGCYEDLGCCIGPCCSNTRQRVLESFPPEAQEAMKDKGMALCCPPTGRCGGWKGGFYHIIMFFTGASLVCSAVWCFYYIEKDCDEIFIQAFDDNTADATGLMSVATIIMNEPTADDLYGVLETSGLPNWLQVSVVEYLGCIDNTDIMTFCEFLVNGLVIVMGMMLITLEIWQPAWVQVYFIWYNMMIGRSLFVILGSLLALGGFGSYEEHTEEPSRKQKFRWAQYAGFSFGLILFVVWLFHKCGCCGGGRQEAMLTWRGIGELNKLPLPLYSKESAEEQRARMAKLEESLEQIMSDTEVEMEGDDDKAKEDVKKRQTKKKLKKLKKKKKAKEASSRNLKELSAKHLASKDAAKTQKELKKAAKKAEKEAAKQDKAESLKRKAAKELETDTDASEDPSVVVLQEDKSTTGGGDDDEGGDKDKPGGFGRASRKSRGRAKKKYGRSSSKTRARSQSKKKYGSAKKKKYGSSAKKASASKKKYGRTSSSKKKYGKSSKYADKSDSESW